MIIKKRKKRRKQFEITHICLECKKMYALDSEVVIRNGAICPSCYGTVVSLNVMESGNRGII